ncbi:AAA family ATPase [Nocardia sp. NPDC046473]|uniref:AAA family ATPase n=1 Tax=Nocardia sp. NPDC046473 TaxID=3155733 RepID=UPI0033FA0DAA
MDSTVNTLVTIRGNSASGKSTVAKAVQQRFDHSRCVVVPQDVVRRQMLRESDEPGAFNITLIEQIARTCLASGRLVIVEGILDAHRYGPMLQRLAAAATRSLHYSFDLTFAETLSRHAGRPQAATIPEQMMAQWYHGWQPVAGLDEVRIDATWTLEQIVDRIHRDVLAAHSS